MDPKTINWRLPEIEEIPNEQGVYWLLDEKDKIIYVLRDKDIRKSALNYYNKTNLKSNKIRKLNYKLFKKVIDAIEFQLSLDEKFIWIDETHIRRLDDIQKIIDNDDLNHIALVITITVLETFLRDRFKEVWQSKWFEMERNSNIIEFRQKILDICKAMSMENEFLSMVFIKNANTESEFLKILYDLLFPFGEKSLIDFQRFGGKLSAKWPYNNFLNIDLQTELNKENGRNWEKLLNYIELRHKIIHGAEEPVDTAIEKSDAEEALKLVEQLKTRIDTLTMSEIFKWD